MNFDAFCNGSYTPFSMKADSQRSMCFYRELVESGQGRNRYSLYGTPGLTLFCNSGLSAAVRGMLELNDHVFGVIDDTAHEIDSTGAVVATYSPLAVDVNPAYMAADTETLMIVAGGVLYRINSSALT